MGRKGEKKNLTGLTGRTVQYATHLTRTCKKNPEGKTRWCARALLPYRHLRELLVGDIQYVIDILDKIRHRQALERLTATLSLRDALRSRLSP